MRRVLLLISAWAVCAAPAFAQARFEITFPAAAHAQPITGRVYVMISRDNEREPRLQISRTGVPFFGRDVDQLKPCLLYTSPSPRDS